MRPKSALSGNCHNLRSKVYDFGQSSVNNKNDFKINDQSGNRNINSPFIGNKNKTSEFFRDTRVDSCSHVIEYKGKSIAVPYTVINKKGRPLSAYKYVTFKKEVDKTVYQKDYNSYKPVMHVGMNKKPLVKYDPNSFRNRLKKTDLYQPYFNTSKMNIGNRSEINQKQWLSTARDSYRWPIKTAVTNSGILSDKYKLSHKNFIAYQ